nr:hypothetical protein [Kofleriaceae bacterium]
MNKLALIAVVLVAACGGGGGNNSPKGPLIYTDPPDGALRLIADKAATPTKMVLDLVVGSTAQTGYATGFDLPLDVSKVSFAAFTPGTALSPGSAPIAAQGSIPTTGPLANELVVAQSQKAAGTGAVATDTMLGSGSVLLSIELDYTTGAPDGTVFDGQGSGFVLPSGGLVDRAGNAIVTSTDLQIGTLVVKN